MLKLRQNVTVTDLAHGKIAGGNNLFCTWPWTGGVHNFGDGEIVIAYTEKDCTYKTREDVEHGEAESRLILCRTLDSGETWPEELRQVLRDNREPFDSWINQGSDPQPIDMTGRDAMFIFWRSFVRDPWMTVDGRLSYRPVTYAMRSTNRGYHWHLPPVVVPHYHLDSIYGGTKYLRLQEGTILAAFGGYPYAPFGSETPDAEIISKAKRAPQDESQRRPSRVFLYISKDQGIHWYFFSTIAREEGEVLGCSYPSLLQLKNGRILCAIGYRFDKGGLGAASWTSLTYSDDAGRTWSTPQRINDLGDQASILQLSDSRILCIYGYRFVPYGLRGVVSEDEGRTWSREFVIRSDGGGPDLGYPVVTELPDGRILVVYYFNLMDETNVELLNGGRRFIASSSFRLY